MSFENDHPLKRDLDAVFKKLKSQQSNKICFDCGSNNPTWASVSYGVFLCIDCSAVHRSLGVHISFIRSIQLDTNWSWLQLRAMQVGGNSNAMNFFRQHGCTTTDAQQKYHSRAAQLYKSKIEQLAKDAMKFHGTKLHIDSHSDCALSPEQKDIDFFAEHSDVSDNFKSMSLNQSQPHEQNGSAVSIPRNSSQRTLAEEVGDGQGPSVAEALTVSPSNLPDAPKSKFIGAKKPAGKKVGKKGGLGATRVQANFADIESAASQKDKQLEQNAAFAAAAKLDEEKRVASAKLVYQEVAEERNKMESQWKHDPKKAEQAERLGMGGGGMKSQGVSHSAFTDMKVITQDSNNLSSVVDTTPGRRDPVDDLFGDSWVSKPSWNSSSNSKFHSDDRNLPDSDWSSAMGSSSRTNEDSALYGRSRGNATQYRETNEAQSKYANAKSLSSDMFSSSGPDDPRANLSRFEGASAIGSDDLFGSGHSKQAHGGNYNYDMQDIKDGVRSGVTRVAGKLSSIATAAYASVQDRYGY